MIKYIKRSFLLFVTVFQTNNITVPRSTSWVNIYICTEHFIQPQKHERTFLIFCPSWKYLQNWPYNLTQSKFQQLQEKLNNSLYPTRLSPIKAGYRQQPKIYRVMEAAQLSTEWEIVWNRNKGTKDFQEFNEDDIQHT